MTRTDVIALVRAKALEYREVPYRLASGDLSHDYIDGKFAVGQGRDLGTVARAVLEVTTASFEAVGGLTMGADALSHAVALIADKEWFSVRKEPKSHGRQAWIEGCRLAPGTRVLLVDDVVTTGGSMLEAYSRTVEVGALVETVVTIVDRGDVARKRFQELGVAYHALVTYHDLGIKAVGGQAIAGAAR